ncbi:MAG: LemA family protein [Planctomycetota bacterium]
MTIPAPASRPIAAQRGAVKAGLLIVLVVLGVAAFLGISQYNGLVGGQETVAAKWQEIDNQYKRRFDLIPNLVETVKGAAEFERSTLDAVVQARAKVGQAQLPTNVPTDPDKLRAYVQAQQGLGSALGRLFAVAENYPKLTATQSYLSLQDQLEGTENRIAVARRDYIDAVRAFNTKRRSFPANLLANTFGFEAAESLPEEEAVRETPSVQFGENG